MLWAGTWNDFLLQNLKWIYDQKSILDDNFLCKPPNATPTQPNLKLGSYWKLSIQPRTKIYIQLGFCPIFTWNGLFSLLTVLQMYSFNCPNCHSYYLPPPTLMFYLSGGVTKKTQKFGTMTKKGREGGDKLFSISFWEFWKPRGG